MNLLQRARLAAALVSLLTLLLTGAFLYAHQHMRNARAAGEYLDTLSVEAAQLRTAAFDYILHRQARALMQAKAKFRRLHALASDDWLTTAVSDDPDEERRLRQQVRDALDDTEAIFNQFPAGDDDPAFAERNRRTYNLFLLHSQSLRSAIIALHPVMIATINRAHLHADIIAVALCGMLLLMVLLAAFLLERHILRPLDRLRLSAIAIGHGDMAVRLHSPRTDEIGSLARAFDDMLDRLEAAHKELEAFAYSVSHDLRAPLRAIDGFSRKLVTGYGGALDDEGRRQLQVVRDNAQRMGRLIDDLLAFSRMGRREMEAQPLDMDAMARAVAAELRSAEPARAIEFEFAPLPAARGDAAMLRQVWANLLGNAVKFTRGRQRARIEIGGGIEGQEILFWIKDNGAGFDMRYADKLFGVFQRLHRQDEFEGTGVGLAIAQRILHRHHGRIWGEGTPDAGATFRFALPNRLPDNPSSGESPP